MYYNLNEFTTGNNEETKVRGNMDHIGFVAETTISLADGTTKSLAELSLSRSGETFHVFSHDDNGRIVIAHAQRPYMIRNENEVTELVEITLTTGDVVRCGIDQKFMLADGTYVRASSLGYSNLMTAYFEHTPLAGSAEPGLWVLQRTTGRYEYIDTNAIVNLPNSMIEARPAINSYMSYPADLRINQEDGYGLRIIERLGTVAAATYGIAVHSYTNFLLAAGVFVGTKD